MLGIHDLPLFIDPAAPHKALAFVVPGGIFDINSMLWCHGLAVFAAAERGSRGDRADELCQYPAR